MLTLYYTGLSKKHKYAVCPADSQTEGFTNTTARLISCFIPSFSREHKQGIMPRKCCVNVAAYYIKELYKIREYAMIKKRKKWMEVSCVFQNCPLSLWSRGKVFKKRQLGSLTSLPPH